MNAWVFFGLLVAFFAILELVPVETAAPESVQPPSRRRVRLIRAALYVVVLTASVGWWFEYEFASFVLGAVFVGVAIPTLIVAVSTLIRAASRLGTRFR
jgi:hypothetical protein